MSGLESFGINKEAFEARIEDFFGKADNLVVSRADDYSSEKEMLVSFKSNNNDVCLNNIAAELGRAFGLKREDLSSHGPYLVLRRK